VIQEERERENQRERKRERIRERIRERLGFELTILFYLSNLLNDFITFYFNSFSNSQFLHWKTGSTVILTRFLLFANVSQLLDMHALLLNLPCQFICFEKWCLVSKIFRKIISNSRIQDFKTCPC